LIKGLRIKIKNKNIEGQNLKYHQLLNWMAKLKKFKAINSQKNLNKNKNQESEE
jgi:hypothetical protein